MEELKPKISSEVKLTVIDDSTSDVLHLNEEFTLSEPSSPVEFVEHAVVEKHEDTIKSEVPDRKCGIDSDNDDIYIKLEPLVSEELHMKNEIGESLMDQPIKTSPQVEQFYCRLCNNKLSSKKYLQYRNNRTKEKSFQCNICDYKCIWKRKMHTRENPLKCGVCDYSCVQKSDLQRHMKNHTVEKPFKFSFCGYCCVRKSNLQEHMKTHTGEKPFKCGICGYSCVRKSDLYRHMKTHTGEKPYKCDVCNYRFIKKNTLQGHMKTHTGEKPFKCGVCDYSCVQKSDLSLPEN